MLESAKDRAGCWRVEQYDVSALTGDPAATRMYVVSSAHDTVCKSSAGCVKLHITSLLSVHAVSTRIRKLPALLQQIENCTTQKTRPIFVIGNTWCVAWFDVFHDGLSRT